MAALAGAASLQAQQFPGFGSLEGRVGMVLPDDADAGLSASVDLSLGFLGSPVLRTLVGFHYFDTDVTYTPPGALQGIAGSISATGGRLGLRLDAFGPARIGPYLLATATVHSVTVDAVNEAQRRQLDDVFGGFVIGGALGGGLHYSLDAAQRFVATGEVRRVFVANIPHWSAELGVRVVPLGRRAYERPFRYGDPRWGVAPGVPVATAEAERARLERERLEAERRLLEEAQRRTEQDRWAQMTEEERRRAALELDEAQRRTEEEAAARAVAETEAARARGEAESARAEAAAAEQRAREAEERLYQSLLDLDRLIANVTEIRETERGLTIVLGQGLFAVGQHTLSPRALDEVQRIAAVLLQYPQYRIAVEGHTDSTGSLEMNQRLSEQRAQSVRAALVAQGIAPDRTEMRGHGPTLPIATNATAAGRAQNRRVEIVLLGAERPAARTTP